MGETWNGCCVSEHCFHSQKSPPVTRHSRSSTPGLLSPVPLVRHRQQTAATTTAVKSWALQPGKQAYEGRNCIIQQYMAPHSQEKKYRNSRSETEIGSQKFLSVYLLHHGTVCSSRGPKTSYAEAFKVPTVACRYLLFTAVSGGPH